MQPPPRPPPLSLVRSLGPADALTVLNAASGTLSLFVCLQAIDDGPVAMWVAFALLPFALVCDVFDGRLARWLGRSSLIGGDLDSLADVISFGVAPAVIAFTLGLRGLWDVVILVYFVVCGVARLARYNATSDALSKETGKVPYFEGTPIPTSLALVALLALAYGLGAVGESLWLGEMRIGPGELHPLSLVFLASGTAMISARLRIPKP